MGQRITSIRHALLLGGSIFAVSAGQAAAQSDVGQVEEIIVTATKRDTRLSETPISIAAYSQESLDVRGVKDLRDVANQTPGVDFSRSGPTRVAIRGVSSTAGAATTAIYIDDTPIQARNAALNYNGTTLPYIFDLERVEVLRGPQGTLFGASAQGGAIRFITPTPSLSDYSAYARAEVSQVKSGGVGYEAGIAVGGPILADKLGFRVSVFHRQEAGWIDRVSWQNPSVKNADTNESFADVIRAALLFQPTDWLAITPSVYYQNHKIQDRASLVTRCPTSPLNLPSPGQIVGAAPRPTNLVACPNGPSDPDGGKFYSYASIAQPMSDHFVSPSLKISADQAGVNLTSVTSVFARHVTPVSDSTHGNDRRELGNNWLYPITPGYVESITTDIAETWQNLFAQEVRISNTDQDKRLSWTVGGYYSRSALETYLPFYAPHFAAAWQARYGVLPEQQNHPAMYPGKGDMAGIRGRYLGEEWTMEHSTALFANIDFKILDNLTLTLGGRYAKDKLDFHVRESGHYYAGDVAVQSGSITSKPFTPKVAIAWQATPDALYYASYSKGYRTGGVNKSIADFCLPEAQALGITPGSYDPDTTRNLEVGTKNRMFGGRLQYEFSAYHIRWSGIQQQLRLSSCAFSLVANTASATSKGFDLNVNVTPMEGLLLSAAVGYTDANYDETIIIGTSPLVTEGQTLEAPPWTVNLAAEYNTTLLDREVFARAQFNWRARDTGPYAFQIPGTTSYDPTRPVPGAPSSLDLRVGVAVNEGVTVSAFVDNALNDVSYLTNTANYLSAGRAAPLWGGTTQRPRRGGLQVIARY
ncbi:TonB-dependent receptor [Phenylobacterium sp.]|uniref:TonB-dependent receptor n=1 Tax=Phenylobacterium sp. TaxID=1871053 RepID=UPI003784F608